ncbi:MAG TPA: DUF1810 domain-containing protein [Methylovirgula sp.]|jgi:uncharacterized protein (DUF1810 family)|nr:DUF1810 domain-containing protein [Methylovirgula sp.]
MSAATDPFDLTRFVEAQASTYAQVLDELREGRKTSHWIWFIFPQLAVLGRSTTAKRYGIKSKDEAAAYLAHPILGTRLRECTGLVNQIDGSTAHDIFGYPDDLKFRSSMTLFAAASADNAIFNEALAKYYDGEGDPLTSEKL